MLGKKAARFVTINPGTSLPFGRQSFQSLRGGGGGSRGGGYNEPC